MPLRGAGSIEYGGQPSPLLSPTFGNAGSTRNATQVTLRKEEPSRPPTHYKLRKQPEVPRVDIFHLVMAKIAAAIDLMVTVIKAAVIAGAL